MKVDERLSPRANFLLFSALEMLRKEIGLRFYSQKDADAWLFSELDLTKDELAQIYKGRDVLYYDGSAVDLDKAAKEYEATLEFAYEFGRGIKVMKVFAEEDPGCGYGHIYSSKRDFDLFAKGSNYLEGYCVVNTNADIPFVVNGCSDICWSVEEAIQDFKAAQSRESLAAKLIDFYKDFDHYDFQDSLEIGQTESDAILQMADDLRSPEYAASLLKAVSEIYRDEDLTKEQKSAAGHIIFSLSGYAGKGPVKAPLSAKIAAAASRAGHASHSQHVKTQETDLEK